MSESSEKPKPALSAEDIKAMLEVEVKPIIDGKTSITFDVAKKDNPITRQNINAAYMAGKIIIDEGNYELPKDLRQAVQIVGANIQRRGTEFAREALAQDLNGDNEVSAEEVGAMALAASLTHRRALVPGQPIPYGVRSEFDNRLDSYELSHLADPRARKLVVAVAEQIATDNALVPGQTPPDKDAIAKAAQEVYRNTR